MKNAVIVSGTRTVIGKLGGSLQDVLVEQLAQPDDLFGDSLGGHRRSEHR
jgi:hypothetical protein